MRIVTQVELDKAEIRTMQEFWTANGTRLIDDCCLRWLWARSQCTEQCVVAFGGEWWWHGMTGESPTPESTTELPTVTHNHRCSICGRTWDLNDTAEAYAHRVHARAATLAAAINGEYDEDAERARLVAVPA